MYVYVCMQVCVCVCLHRDCGSVFAHTGVGQCMYGYAFIYVCAECPYSCVCDFGCVYERTGMFSCTCERLSLRVHADMFACVYMSACMCMSVCT